MILDSALLSVLSSLFLLLSQAEVQWSCSQHERCQMLCSCRGHPLPPPPPPPPPRMLLTVDTGISVPLLRSWWLDVIVLGTVGSALALFLLFSIIICYKAINRKALKEKKDGRRSHEAFTKTAMNDPSHT